MGFGRPWAWGLQSLALAGNQGQSGDPPNSLPMVRSGQRYAVGLHPSIVLKDLLMSTLSRRHFLGTAALLVAIAVLAALVPGHAFAGPSMPTAEEIEELNALTGPSATPHTRWAKPYARGPIRVLFVIQQQANVNVLPLRQAVEIMQRFDITGDAVLVMKNDGDAYATTYAGGSGVFGGPLGGARLARLLEQRYDCYVVVGEVLGHLPETARETILTQVRDGAGLAFLYPVGDADGPALVAAEPWEAATKFLEGLDATCWRLGRGRVISYAPPVWRIYVRQPEEVYGHGHIFGTNLPRDLRFEAQGRAILWAAQREPQVQLSVSVPERKLDRSRASNASFQVAWKGASLTGSFVLKTRIRAQARGSKRFPAIRNVDIDGPESSRGMRDYPLAGLPAGRYVIDAILQTDDGIAAWATCPLTITSRARIVRVELDRTWGEVGTSIGGVIAVEAGENSAPRLRVQVIDRYGRALARRDYDTFAREQRFSLPTASWMPHYLGVEAALVVGNKEIAHGYAPDPYTIPQRRHDRFSFTLWGRLYSGEFDDIAEDFLAASGVTTRLETSHSPWWFMTRADMNYTPYCSSGLYRMPDHAPQEPAVDGDGFLANAHGCWNLEPTATRQLDEYLDAENDYRQRGVLAYSMGDERAVFGSCLHPACWNVYLDWLKQQYGDIAALNLSWGTDFHRFDQIEPVVDETNLHWLSENQKRSLLLSAANNEHGAKGLTHGSTAWTEASKSYPRYVDRRAFQYWNFANYARRFGDAARRIDPHARCGVEGVDVHLDVDIDVIVRHTGWWMPYGEHGGATNEVIRSIAPRGYLHGNFVGRSFFWESVLRGGNAVGRWRIDNFLTPQMTLKRSIRRRVESAQIITDGLGTLLNVHRRTSMLHDGIVMLHSMAAVQVAKIATSHDTVEAGPTYGHFRARDHQGRNRSPDEKLKRSHLSWHRAIRACGLQFMYATDGQIKRGEFDPSPYKVMILSQYEAIGPEEEAAIRAFAEEGGTVIADVRPGLYGARGKAREGGVLDDLFGVRHVGNRPARKSDGALSGRIGATPINVQLANLHVNPAVELNGGRALGTAGDTPIGVVNAVGKGRAVLLNFTIWSYPNLAVHNGPDGAGEALRGIFASAGIAWPLLLRDEAGRHHRNMEAMRWGTGDGVEVVAVYGPIRGTWSDGPLVPPSPYDGFERGIPVTVRLPEARHVYEMRSGRDLGHTDALEIALRPWWATFLVLSERALAVPILRMDQDAVRRGVPLVIAVDIPGSRGVRALKVQATGPQGQAAPWFARPVFIEDGRGEMTLPIAHNEEVGNWTVTATDLFTGQTAEQRFVVP